MADLMVLIVVCIVTYILVMDVLMPLAAQWMTRKFERTFGVEPKHYRAQEAVARHLGEITAEIRANELDAEYVLRREMGVQVLLNPFEVVRNRLILKYAQSRRLAALHGHVFPLLWSRLGAEQPAPLRGIRSISLADALLS